MMEEDKLIKTIKLRGGSLQAAKRYNELLEVSRDEYQLRHDEAARELRALQSKHISILREAWLDMVKGVFTSPSPEETWQNPNYRLDITYLNEHHEAFLNIYNTEDSSNEVQVPAFNYSNPTGGGLVH